MEDAEPVILIPVGLLCLKRGRLNKKVRAPVGIFSPFADIVITKWEKVPRPACFVLGKALRDIGRC